MEVSSLTELKNTKSGDHVEVSGVYYNIWGQVEILKKGVKFPKDPMFGQTEWKLAHYPFNNQITSKKIPKEYWNEIKVDNIE